MKARSLVKKFINVVNVETGEIYDEVKVISKEDLERCKQFFETQREYEYKGMEIKEKYKENGSFVWLLYNAGKALDLGITSNELTKLIFISTYMDYNNRLMLSENKIMRKSDMQQLLKVSERTFINFWKSITDSKLLIKKTDSEELYLNTDLFLRGHTAQSDDMDRIRLYRRSIRKLYKQAKIGEHKLLSYLFQAIPFVNINYNIICHNPTETDLDMVKPMTMADYCGIIGYNSDNCRRLKTMLKKLKLNKTIVFSFVDNANGLFCYINPNVYYAGNSWDKVEVLGEFCK